MPRKTVLLALACLTLATGACSRSKKQTPEAFFAAIDLEAMARRNAPAGLRWGGVTPHDQPGHKALIAFLNGDPATFAGFVEGVEADFLAALAQAGGKRLSVAPVLPDTAPLHRLQVDYELGGVRGWFRVAIRRGTENAEFPYALAVALKQPAAADGS